jgi:hypothetical protein
MKKLILFTITLAVFVHFANAQWQFTGLVGINVNSIAVIGNNIFAGSNIYGDGNGVYLSSDNGNNWTMVNNGMTDTTIYALATSGNNIFAGSRAGVYLSTNNGQLWTPVNNGFLVPPHYVSALTTDSVSNIFAGTGFGEIYLSTNNGGNWTNVNNGVSMAGIESFVITGNDVFAATQNGIFYSSNYGNNWIAVNNGLTTNDAIWAITLCGNNLFAGTNNNIYISSNNGSNWTPVNTGLPIDYFSVSSFAIDGSNIFAGVWGYGIFLSTNNGSSWTEVNNGLTNYGIVSLAISGDTLFAGTDSTGGVWKRSITEILSTNCSAQFAMIPDTLVEHHYYAVNSASGVQPLTYLWSWGDGSFDSTAYPSHVYDTAGYYNICLTISDAIGCSSTYCDSSYLQKSANTIISVDVIPPGATAINENELSGQIKIYPNPANEEINIYSNLSSVSIEQIRIIDMLGRQRYYSDKTVTSINTAFLEQGVYFIEIKEKDQPPAVLKFIISR